MRIPLAFSREEIPFKKGIKEDIMDVVAFGLDLKEECVFPGQASKQGLRAEWVSSGKLVRAWGRRVLLGCSVGYTSDEIH